MVRLRKYMAAGYADSALWSRVAVDLASLTADRTLQVHARNWPDTVRVEGTPSNLLFYLDPDYGFVINAQVLQPYERTGAHDHGESWNLYAVLDGGERIEHFRPRRRSRAADVAIPLELIAVHDSKPGYVDLVPPGHIHRKANGDRRTINLVVRSQHARAFRRYHYDPDTGSSLEYPGPVQIPYALT